MLFVCNVTKFVFGVAKFVYDVTKICPWYYYMSDMLPLYFMFFFLRKVNVNQCKTSQKLQFWLLQKHYCSFSNLISHFKALFQTKLSSCNKMFRGKQFKK